jgi:hypothetical protein
MFVCDNPCRLIISVNAKYSVYLYIPRAGYGAVSKGAVNTTLFETAQYCSIIAVQALVYCRRLYNAALRDVTGLNRTLTTINI